MSSSTTAGICFWHPPILNWLRPKRKIINWKWLNIIFLRFTLWNSGGDKGRSKMPRRGMKESNPVQTGLNTQLLEDVEKALVMMGIPKDEVVVLRTTIKFTHSRNPILDAAGIAKLVAKFSSVTDAGESLNVSSKEQAFLAETEDDWKRLKA